MNLTGVCAAAVHPSGTVSANVRESSLSRPLLVSFAVTVVVELGVTTAGDAVTARAP
jgi:hypothetical protein